VIPPRADPGNGPRGISTEAVRDQPFLIQVRVRSFFQAGRPVDPQRGDMVSQIVDLDLVLTDTEMEALALENNFIKRHQPRFNILLRDDKNHPYLKLTLAEEYPRLHVVRRDIAEANALVPHAQQPIAVLHPGGSDPRRRWPVEKFGQVGDALVQAGAQVVVTGAADESGLAEAVAGAMARDVLNLCGRLTLNGLAGLLAISAVVVSNDTGPLHLARAVGASTVGIYWVGNIINAGSLTVGRHRSFFSWQLDCPECGKNCTETSCTHTASFVRDVDPREVATSACELFNGYRGEYYAER
jgi:ADP-heptose:LPS heptosyltransferase